MPDVAPGDQVSDDEAEPRVAVVRTGNGELAESTIAAERQEDALRRAQANGDDDSFPASDPPSGWAGESRADAERSPVHEVVDVRPLGDDEELQVPPER